MHFVVLAQEAEEERERQEEAQMLRVMEEQKIAEAERLQKAIELADKERVEEIKRKEEEDKQRIEVSIFFIKYFLVFRSATVFQIISFSFLIDL